MVTVVASDGGASGGDGWQAITTEGADSASLLAAACGGGEGDRGIAGESLTEPFGWLTAATPFGVVPLPGGVVLAYPSPFLTILRVKTLLRLPNERWRRSTSRPPWGHRFGETYSYKDVVDGLCICFESFQP
uniref:Uncharacterized protein n=1 Tax=Oryza barthii TaxID=65489 RepID=A0A0D3H7B9_9ORYZ